MKQQNLVMENQILEAISYIKNVSKKSPNAGKNLNHISKTLASNIDLPSLDKLIKELIAEIKINDYLKIMEEPRNGDLIRSTDEA